VGPGDGRISTTIWTKVDHRDDIASSDVFLFPSRTDTYGQVVVEAQASGLPVVAVAEGGPLSLIDHRHTGWCCPPEADALAAAVAQLAESRSLRERISRAALEAIRGRTWEAAFGQLAAGYELALARARRTRATAPVIADAA
jgi:glycosyltransferase involved in cell wall biosynthesis